MRKHVKTLANLDKDIVGVLESLRDCYRLAMDATVMQRSYLLESSIAKLVAERVAKTGEDEDAAADALARDPVAISSVAVDAGVSAAELGEEMESMRLVIKEGFDQVNKDMTEMLAHKSSDRGRLKAILSVVQKQHEKSALDPDLEEKIGKVTDSLVKTTKKEKAKSLKMDNLEQFEVELVQVEDVPFARGGQGSVHLAEYSGETVCLKKMSQVGVTAAKRQKMFSQFSAELSIMVRLRSPRVVQVLGVVTTDPTYLGLVVEYLPGGSLRGALDADSEIGAEQQRIWCADVAHGMAYLYKSRIEHRDLKSLNVLLTHDSRCKVTDFGLSKCDDLSTAATATVAGGGLAGTPAFMAPELLEDNTFSEKSDVFSYAMVLFEIWSRDVPWSGLQPPQIISKVLVKHARPETPPSMAPDMAALMAKCWAQDPDARPDFKAIVAELRGSTKSALRGSGAAGERPSQSSWMSSVGSNAQGTTRSLSSWIAAARGSA